MFPVIIEFVKKHCHLLGVAGVLGFVVFSRIGFIDLPFFWDEMGVYGNAAFYMHDHGVSVLPSSLPTELSRGHPLLYAFLNACVTRLFGANVTVLHLFNLSVSLVLLLSVYRVGSSLFHKDVGFVAAVLLAVQPLFLAQSVMVLPEIMLALGCTWLIYGFIGRKTWLIVLAGCFSVLIKETAIVVVVGLAIYEIVENIYNKNNIKAICYGLFKWASVAMTFGLFLLIQKLQNGWFFFPYHSRGFDLRIESVWYSLSSFGRFLFWDQHRWVLLVAGVLVFTIEFFYRRSYRRSVSDRLAVRPVSVLAVVTLIFLMFSATTFYMDRYVVLLFVPFLLVVAYILVGKRDVMLFRYLGVAAIVIVFIFYQPKGFLYDVNDGYKQQVVVLKDALNAFEEVHMPVSSESTFTDGNFPAYFAMRDHRFGYVSEEMAEYVNNQADYLIDSMDREFASVDFIEQYYFLCRPGSTEKRFSWKEQELLKVFENEYASVELYKLK